MKKICNKQIEQVQKLTGKSSKPQNNYFNIEKLQVFVTEPVDFVDILTVRFGGRQKAIDFVRSKVNKKMEGDIDMFCEIYLHGDPDTWSIACLDKKNHVYRIADQMLKLSMIQVALKFIEISEAIIRIHCYVVYCND